MRWCLAPSTWGAFDSLLRLNGLLREVLLGENRAGIAELQGGHESRVHLRGRHDGTLELLIGLVVAAVIVSAAVWRVPRARAAALRFFAQLQAIAIGRREG